VRRVLLWVIPLSLSWGWTGAMLPAAGETRADRPSATAPVAVRLTSRGDTFTAETTNFCCRVQGTAAAARDLALACERERARLCGCWHPEGEAAAWVPRCEVVVHATQAIYNQCLGRPGDASVGSTRMNFDGPRVVYRRIDLRADAADWTTAALPHELTHVVLGDRFAGRPLPPWADEGIAMLSENPQKQALRLADLRQTLRAGNTLPLRDLLAQTGPPRPEWRRAFYGQSLLLTSALIERSSPQTFVRFLDRSQQDGVEAALQRVYGLAGTAALQGAWNEWTRTPERLRLVDLRQGPAVPAMARSDRN